MKIHRDRIYKKSILTIGIVFFVVPAILYADNSGEPPWFSINNFGVAVRANPQITVPEAGTRWVPPAHEGVRIALPEKIYEDHYYHWGALMISFGHSW